MSRCRRRPGWGGWCTSASSGEVFADKARGEDFVRHSALDWTIAYPVTLTNKPATGTFVATPLAEIGRLPGMPKITRADVAAYLLQAAAAGGARREIVVVR